MTQTKIESLIDEIGVEFNRQLKAGELYTDKKKMELVARFKVAINAPKTVLPKSLGLSRGHGTKPHI